MGSRGPDVLRKNLKTKSEVTGCRLQIYVNDDRTGLTLRFVNWVTTSQYPQKASAAALRHEGRPARSDRDSKPFGGGCQPPDRLLAEVKPLDGGYEADFEAHNHHREARGLRDPGSLVITTIVRLERAQRDRAALRDGRPASPCDSSGNGLT